MTIARCWVCLWMLLAAGAGAWAQSPALPAGVAQVQAVEGITEYRLANGLQLLLVPDDSKPTTTVNVVYRVGSRHENYGETGMAHLLEHLLFKGTPTTRNVWSEFTRRGLRANGTTWFDRTNYFASFAVNDDNLQWYLSWQADIMVNSFIARSDLDTEMTVVRNEFERGENNPGRVLYQKLLSGMYDWHSYGKSTIGARSDIENVDIGRLQAFYRLHYQPDNATLVVAGRFDTAQVLTWVARYFGAIPKPARSLPGTYTLEPAQDGDRLVQVRRVGGTPLVYLGYHVVPGAHPDYAAVQLLALVLGDTPSGRLHKRLVETRLAAQAFSSLFPLAEPGNILLGLGLAPGQDVNAARNAMVGVTEGLAAEPVTDEELARARRSWLNGWDQGFADPERVGVALSEAIAQGDWRLYFLQRDRVRAVGLQDLNRVAAAYLKRDNRTLAIYEPADKPERAPTPARVDVAAQLQGYRGDASAGAAEAFDPTPAKLDQRTQRSNLGGLQVALLPKGTRGQVVQAQLVLRHGDADSLKGLATVAEATAAMLDKGGAGLSRQQIADALEGLQAQVSFGGVGQTLSLGIETRRDRLPALIALVGRLLREPAFEAGPLEEWRRQRLASLEQQRKEPDAVITNRLARHGNPYPVGDLRHVPSFAEQVQAVQAVRLEDVKAFHRRFYSAAFGEFAAVGDFDSAAVQQALQSALAGWRQPADGALPFTRIPRPLVDVAALRFVEITPDKANANLRGRLSLPLNDSDPEHVALTLANYIFGSGGSSRLWTRIRETDGLSYDVRSVLSVNPQDLNSSWQLSAIFAPQNQPRVEVAVQQELARALDPGFTEAELAAAKKALLNFRRLSRAQDAVLAGQLAQDLYLGRRFQWAQQIDDALAAATLAQVNASWRKYIQPQKLVVGWGGDFKQP